MPHIPMRTPMARTLQVSALIALLASTQVSMAGPGSRSGNAGGTAEARERVARPAPSAEQQDNIAALKADVGAQKANSNVSDSQKEQLKGDISAAVDGAQRPSQESIDTLATDLSAFVADGSLSKQEMKAIQNDVNAILNSANITDDEIAALKASTKAIAEASNLDKDDIKTLVDDVTAIAKTAQVNGQAAADTARSSIQTRAATAKEKADSAPQTVAPPATGRTTGLGGRFR